MRVQSILGAGDYPFIESEENIKLLRNSKPKRTSNRIQNGQQLARAKHLNLGATKMFLNMTRRILAFGSSIGSTRQRVMVGALVVAAVAVACGTDSPSAPAAGGDTSAPDGGVVNSGPIVKSDDAAPSFNVETFHHGTYNLDETVGNPVLINFWVPSCPPCRAELPDLQAAYEEFGDEIDFLGVQQTSVDTLQEGIDFLLDLGITYPNFADEGDGTSSQVQISYRVLSFPTTVFLNRDHSISRTWSGLINEKNLKKEIEKVIAS